MRKFLLLIILIISLAAVSCDGEASPVEDTSDTYGAGTTGTGLPEATDTQPVDTQPVDTQPVDTQPVVTQPIETKPETTEATAEASVTTSPEEEWSLSLGYKLTNEPADGTTGAYIFKKGTVHSGTGIYYIGDGENRYRIIVIDAGHQMHGMSEKEPNGPGSSDMKAMVSSGTTGKFTGIPEYKLNLAVALLLRDELIARGYSVVMVRETDNVEISNAERAKLAGEYADKGEVINLRIHANGSVNPETNGAITVCQTAKNPYIPELYTESRALSGYVLDGFCKSTGIRQGSSWETDTMTGINWCTVPSTIVEMGYMSNEADDRLMSTDEFRMSAAEGIADGIDRYFGADTMDDFTECDKTMTATGNICLRTEPSTDGGDATKIAVLKAGEAVRCTGYNESFCRVIYNDEIAYASKKYLN